MTLILPPFKVGETATLHAPADLACTVTAPDHTSSTVERRGERRIDIPLTQAGIYRYEFSDGSTGELLVSDGAARGQSVP